MSPKVLLGDKTRGRPTLDRTLPAKIYSNTNAPTNNRWAIHEELQELGVSHSNWISPWLLLCLRLLKLLLLGLAFDLLISL